MRSGAARRPNSVHRDLRGRAGAVLAGVWLFAACAWLAGACAGAQRGRALDMDAIVIRAQAPADLPTDVYDAETVLHYAREAERVEDYAKARRLFERLLKEFPTSRLARSARFGKARMVQVIEGCPAALPLLEAIRAEPAAAGPVNDWVDAHFREAACLVHEKRAQAAADVLSALLKTDGLGPYDRMEAQVGRGIALEELGDLNAAEKDFILVFAADRGTPAGHGGEPDPATRFVLAKAGFHLGEINRLHFEKVALEFPQEVLGERLEEKSQYLLRAQTYYLRAIRLGDLEVAAAAGFRIGSMYEHFHGEIVALHPPPDVTTEQAEVYMQEVRSKIAILLRKAVKIFDEAIAMARRTGLKNSAWIDKSSEALERIKKVYLNDISS